VLNAVSFDAVVLASSGLLMLSIVGNVDVVLMLL